MKILKIKFGLYSLLATLSISAFFISCEQEKLTTIQTSDEIQTMMSKIILDEDVSVFIDAATEFYEALRNDGVNEQIRINNISNLRDQMLKTGDVVSTKYPNIGLIDKESIEKFHYRNTQFKEIENIGKSTEVKLRCCPGFWNELLYGTCHFFCQEAFNGNLDTLYDCFDGCFYKHCT